MCSWCFSPSICSVVTIANSIQPKRCACCHSECHIIASAFHRQCKIKILLMSSSSKCFEFNLPYQMATSFYEFPNRFLFSKHTHMLSSAFSLFIWIRFILIRLKHGFNEEAYAFSFRYRYFILHFGTYFLSLSISVPFPLLLFWLYIFAFNVLDVAQASTMKINLKQKAKWNDS